MDVVHHHVPFLDSSLLLLRPLAEHWPQVLPSLLEQLPPTVLWDEHDVVCALLLRVT